MTRRIAAVIVGTVATFGVGFGTAHHVYNPGGTVSVTTVEATRLAACDDAVKRAVDYDQAKASGRNVQPALAAYWAAKDACAGSPDATVKAAR